MGQKHIKIGKKIPISLVHAMHELHTLYTRGKKPARVAFDGFAINMNSQRIKLFILKGITCVNCGRKGTHYSIDRHADQEVYHVNLRGKNNLLFTKDHIKPKHCGGKNRQSNYQTMCAPCNYNKGHKWDP